SLRVGIPPVLGNFDRVSQGDGDYVLRIVGDEDGRKILVRHAGPVEWSRKSRATTDFLDVQAFRFVVVLVLDATARVRGRTQLIAETRRPRGESGNRAGLGDDRGFDMHHISLVEAKSFADRDILVGIFEGQLPWSTQIARSRGDIKGGVDPVRLSPVA